MCYLVGGITSTIMLGMNIFDRCKLVKSSASIISIAINIDFLWTINFILTSDRVKKHKKDYVASRELSIRWWYIIYCFCKLTSNHLNVHSAAKAQKPIFSSLIYDEIRAMNPPGRFLKQDPQTKLWSDIGKKKALDKTRQALREGAPDLIKGDGDEESNEEKQPKAKKSRTNRKGNDSLSSSFASIGSVSVDGANFQKSMTNRKGNDPLSSSFASIGSFSVDSANFPSPDLFSTASNLGGGNNIPAGILGGNSLQNNLMAAQVQLLSQWQNLMNLQNALQNSATPPDPNAQMQLLNLQMQLQNQMQQQQQQQSLPNLANFLNAQNLANMNSGNNPSFPSFPQFNAAPQAQMQLNDPNLAAMLAVLQNNAANQNNQMQNQNQSFQNFQNQMAMMALTQQINNATNQAAKSNANANSSTNPQGGTPNNNIQNILSAANVINKDSVATATATESQSKERKTGGTSLARSKRIGLKNSFTARRPNSHKQTTNALTTSQMSVDIENMNLEEDDDEEEDADEKETKVEAKVDKKPKDSSLDDEDNEMEV